MQSNTTDHLLSSFLFSNHLHRCIIKSGNDYKKPIKDLEIVDIGILFHFMLDCPEYTPIRNNYLNLIIERFPGLVFLELSPFDKMQFLIGDISFSLDTHILLFVEKNRQNHVTTNVFTQEVLFRKQDNITICHNPVPVSRF
jgi:hypothetical protein